MSHTHERFPEFTRFYPLTPDADTGRIRLPPAAVRVHFREPDDRELTVRGAFVYDRTNHTYVFPPDARLRVTLTLLLPFEQLPEAARRYTALKAMRVFQERVVGSQQLSQFHQTDEARARALMMAEERRQDRPNILKGTLPPTGTWRVTGQRLNDAGFHFVQAQCPCHLGYPLKGSAYSRVVNLSCMMSFFSCCWIYFLIVASLRPTVLT